MEKFRPYVPISGEQWEKIDGFPGYEISDLGRVRKAWIINSWKDHEYQRGYQFIQLWYKAKRKVRSVHSLVAEAFVGPRPKGWIVHHKDGDKHNNTAKNLEYLTRAANNKHARETGLWIPTPKGTENPNAKFTADQAKQVRELYWTGKYSQQQLADKFKVTRGTIGRLLRGETY